MTLVLRALVVDDEAPARRRLTRMLARLEGDPAVKVTAEASDGVEAIERLREEEFDLAFVDINMPGIDGLSLAKVADLPTTVFVTAHDEHAIAAFEVGALDYLLKPVSTARLQATVDRVRDRIRERLGGAKPFVPADEVEATLSRAARGGRERKLSAASPTDVRVAVRSASRTRLFDPREIDHFWSSDKYSAFAHEGSEQLLDESLNELELRLGDHGFARVHRRSLVRLAAVTALHTSDRGLELELRSGERVHVSRRMAAVVKQRLGL